MKRGWGIAVLGAGCALVLTAVVRVPGEDRGDTQAVRPADVQGPVVTEIERMRIPDEATPRPKSGDR